MEGVENDGWRSESDCREDTRAKLRALQSERVSDPCSRAVILEYDRECHY